MIDTSAYANAALLDLYAEENSSCLKILLTEIILEGDIFSCIATCNYVQCVESTYSVRPPFPPFTQMWFHHRVNVTNINYQIQGW